MRVPPWGDPTAPTAGGASSNLIIVMTPRTAYHTEIAGERLQVLFHSANALHQNFYEGWMPTESVAAGLSSVEEFAGRLADLID